MQMHPVLIISAIKSGKNVCNKSSGAFEAEAMMSVSGSGLGNVVVVQVAALNVATLIAHIKVYLSVTVKNHLFTAAGALHTHFLLIIYSLEGFFYTAFALFVF